MLFRSILIGVVALYALGSALKLRPLRIGKLSVEYPSLSIAARQVAIAPTEIICAAHEPRRHSRPLRMLLQHVEWQADRSIRFDITTFDRRAYLDMVGSIINSPDFASIDGAWSHAKWWTWGADGPSGVRAPSWWSIPSEYVVRYMFRTSARFNPDRCRANSLIPCRCTPPILLTCATTRRL